MKNRRRRAKDRLARLARQANTAKERNRDTEPASAPRVDLSFLEAATVAPRAFETAQILLAGCGGIGSYTAQHIGRLIRVLYDELKGVNLTFVDPDQVEGKNVGRQLFCDAEIGKPKALALAQRYGGAWGINTMAFVGEFSEDLIDPTSDIVVIVGCVDNSYARAAINECLLENPVAGFAQPRVWWLDCGNVRDAGRALLGSAYSVELMQGAIKEKKIGALPSPALQYPSLLIPAPEDQPDSGLSCAEMQLRNLQSLNINAAIAVQAADMLTRLLLTKDLKRYQAEVNLASGVCRSWYCTPETLARELDVSSEFLTEPPAEVFSEPCLMPLAMGAGGAGL